MIDPIYLVDLGSGPYTPFIIYIPYVIAAL